ncbi:unnamed protein product [Echinostoma caproni]|uniref:BHLH domain-containing protein n=1 Tax=Echinostoma caproni TaxID=27848 RepID=A0A183ARH7_9TREM|nr:unnamed protein product [Echinostoma caproni]
MLWNLLDQENYPIQTEWSSMCTVPKLHYGGVYTPYNPFESDSNTGQDPVQREARSDTPNDQTTYTCNTNWSALPGSNEDRYTCRERRRRKRASAQYRRAHAARERLRVEAFNKAFGQLRTLLPTGQGTGNDTQSDRRLSKLQILRLCSAYIFNLTQLLYGTAEQTK